MGAFGSSLYQEISRHKNVTAARSIGLSSAKGEHYASNDPKKRTLKYGYIDRPSMTESKPTGTVPQLSMTLNSEKPDILVVELADNFADYRGGTSGTGAVKVEVQKILNQIAASSNKPKECFWVGPVWTDWVDDNGLPLDKRPHGRGTFYKKTNLRAQQVAAAIKKEIAGKCTFIDSFKILEKSEIKTSDGIHCVAASGKLWGQRVYEEINGKSALLGNSKPLKSAPKVKINK